MSRLTFVFVALFVCLGCFFAVVVAGEDYYSVMGVTRSSSTAEIKKAYRSLSKQFHPDKNPGNQEAADKFAEINNAYEVLKDDEKRRLYDQYGEEGLKNKGGNRGGWNPFGDIFGRQQQREKRGADIQLPLFLSLKDLYLGKEIRLINRRQILCTECRGSGAKDADDVKKCSACGGKGVKIVKKQIAPGFSTQMQQTCDVCNGKGTVASSKCPHCGGTKVEIGEQIIVVYVEKGMPEGHQIVFPRQGDVQPDATPGDLKFTIHILPDPMFRREGNDLHYTMEISLLEALVGYNKELVHFDGHVVPLSRTQVSKPGLVTRVPKEGMPYHEFPSQKGTLFVHHEVIFPTSITEEQRQGFLDLLKE